MTLIRGMFSANASDFAKVTPTCKEPKRPGCAVVATADRSANFISAAASAFFTTGMIHSMCAREATSGTTPPYCACCN